jgi:toxin CcdB
MAQFDVYENKSKSTKHMFPLLVDIQHDVISEIATRIVLPLARPEYFSRERMTVLTPTVKYDGEKLILLTPQIAAMPAKKLQEPIGTMEHFRDEIIAALDLAISGI